MKRVLIITYYWPPSGGSGVQRWLKMSKYLPENGWQPVIYTPEDGEYPIEDPTLEKDVSPEAEIVKRPIIEPYTLYKKFLGIKKEDKVKAGFIQEKGRKNNWKENLSIWIRGNLFIPDARLWWVKPSVRFLKEYLKRHPVDAIISTGPPHSMHLIAMKLKEDLEIPWIADFRDPWTGIEYYQDLKLTRRSDRKHHRLEHEVLTRANKVVTVSHSWAQSLEQLGAKDVAVVHNGFDASDTIFNDTNHRNDKFTLTYLGVLFKVRNPHAFWQALGELVKEDESFCKDLEINMIGQIDSDVRQCIDEQGLQQNVNFKPYIPHDQVAQALHDASALLLFMVPATEPKAQGLVPAKLFEYMASGRPIVAIGSEDGDTARIINDAHAGTTIGFEDKDMMKAEIKRLYELDRLDALPICHGEALEKYSRHALAGEYVKLLDILLELQTNIN